MGRYEEAALTIGKPVSNRPAANSYRDRGDRTPKITHALSQIHVLSRLLLPTIQQTIQVDPARSLPDITFHRSPKRVVTSSHDCICVCVGCN